MGLFLHHWCLFVNHLHSLWELITLSEAGGPDGLYSETPLVKHTVGVLCRFYSGIFVSHYEEKGERCIKKNREREEKGNVIQIQVEIGI